MPPSLTITNARLVLPDREAVGDVVVEHGVITAIGPRQPRIGTVIDGTGKVVLPGVIDTQVHLRSPEPPHAADVLPGTVAAALGGVTSVLGMPDCAPPVTTARQVAHKLELAEQAHCPTHYGFFLAVTRDNQEWWDTRRAVGLSVNWTARRQDLRSCPGDLEQVLQATTRTVAVHAEGSARFTERSARYTNVPDDPAQHGLIRDEQTATEGLERVIQAVRRVRHATHVTSVSTAAELALLEDAPEELTVGVALHHLLLSDPGAYQELGHVVVVDPPLRPAGDVEALWQAVRDGRVHAVHSAHLPVRRIAKDRPYPRTAPGLPSGPHLLPLMADQVAQGRLTWVDLARVLCSGPAMAFGLERKGRLEVGLDADLVVLDPDAERVVSGALTTAPGWSPWSGRVLRGWPETTVLRGKVVVDGGKRMPGITGRPLS